MVEDGLINPATGLIMHNGIDTGGNLYGMAPSRLGDDRCAEPAKDISWHETPTVAKVFTILFVILGLGTIAWNLIDKALR